MTVTLEKATTLTARDIMYPRVSLPAKEHGRGLISKMLANYPALPVVNEHLEVIGIVSEYDILDALMEGRTINEFSAESVMSCGHAEHDVCTAPLTVSPDTSVDEVLRVLYRENFSILPVVEDRKLVGIITRKCIINALAEEYLWPEHQFQKRV